MIRRVPLAWLQLTHHKGRFLVALAGVAFAVILMFMQLGFQDALYEDAITIHKTLKADLILISPKSVALFGTSTFPRRRLYDALEVDGVATASPFYLGGGQWKNPQNQSSRGITILAFDPDKPIFNLSKIDRNIDAIRQADIVLFDSLSRSEYGPIAAKFDEGESISTEINGRKIRVGGLFALGGGVMSADGLLISSDLNFLRIRGGSLSEINLGLLTLEPGANSEQVRQQLMTNLQEDVKVMTKQEFLDFEQNYWKKSSPIGFIFSVGLSMGFFIGAVIVYQILYTDVTNHLAEYATLKAIGYQDGYLLITVLQEALLLATLGFIPGLIISISLYDLTKDAARLPMATNLGRIVFILGLTVLMCFVSGVIAVRKLRAVDPADVF
ncbi:MAG: FtsX-like permease family protein [Pleurocapsa sp. CRU_1_2]|nr:FtsX-like permease family protein [Pleurocapsa sp. CRU_1_2]